MNKVRIVYKELADMDPRDVVMDTDLVGSNPFTNWEDYQANKASIADPSIGQLEAIVLYKGKCIDGYHRTKICKELGINVRVREITNELSEEQLLHIVLAFEARRNTTLTQKAVRAYRLSKEYGISMVDAAKSAGVRVQLVKYVSTIAKYGYADTLNNGVDRLLEELFQGRKIKIIDCSKIKETTSLEASAKYMKSLAEGSIEIDDKYTIQWNPDSHIKNEAGKKWYYENMKVIEGLDSVKNNVHLIQCMIELANYKTEKSK